MSSGNASIETGHFAELASAVIQQLPRDIGTITAQGWIENRAALQKALRAVLLQTAQRQGVEPAYPYYLVTVNCGLSLAEMIAAGRYDWKNDDITEKHFPLTGEGTREVVIELVHFNRIVESEEALRELDNRGLRPAILEELLAFGAKYPELQKQFPVVALGSVWRRLGGDRDVPCLGGGGRGRNLYLSLGWFESGWDGGCRFAAVRK